MDRVAEKEPDTANRTQPVLGRCQNCEAGEGFDAIFHAAAEMWRCRACGGWSFAGRVTDSVEELYDETYFSGGEYASYQEGERAFRRNFAHVLALVERHGRPLAGARVAELGCATGLFMELARERGAQAIGIEPSVFAGAAAKRRGLEVYPPGEEATRVMQELSPNMLVAWDVWEHLRRPAEQMNEMLNLCSRDVTLALTTVDAGSLVARTRRERWRQFHPPTHLHYPTRASLVRFLHARGFEITCHRSVGYYRPFVAYLKALRLDRLPLPQSVRSLPVYLDLFDIQLIIARRSGIDAPHWSTTGNGGT